MPLPETLTAYYSDYYATHSENSPKITFARPDRLAAHIVDILGVCPSCSPIRILDFGGGDGFLSILIAARLITSGAHSGASIDVIDYAHTATPPDPRIEIRHAGSLHEVSSFKYDLVLASSIMEHIPDARADFERLFEAIAPAGRMYARTPWIAPVFSLLERMFLSFDFTFPAHVHDFGKAFWEGLPTHLDLDPTCLRLTHSAPSPVESGFREAPLRTAAAHLLKAPWYLWPRSYDFVGGWEVMFVKRSMP
jgi:hypothetical protein